MWLGPEAGAQPAPLPPALDDRPSPPVAGDRRSELGAAESLMPVRPAPRPIPGPAGTGLPRGGRDAAVTRGVPINFATAMALAGIRPLDIAAATALLQQALALHLQAKALWIPSINGGIDYFRHDGVQQNIFTGENFRKGRQTFLIGGGPFLNVGVTDAIFAPLAARRVVAARQADLQAARNDVLLQVSQAFFNLQAARGRLLGVRASIDRAELLVNFTKGLAPSLIAPLEINRAQAELQSLRQTQQVAIRDWRVASAQLAEILLLEPSTLLEPIEPPFLQVTLVPCCAGSA
jgi:outer membrane protein TolC